MRWEKAREKESITANKEQRKQGNWKRVKGEKDTSLDSDLITNCDPELGMFLSFAIDSTGNPNQFVKIISVALDLEGGKVTDQTTLDNYYANRSKLIFSSWK